jgi:hypothetical protein
VTHLTAENDKCKTVPFLIKASKAISAQFYDLTTSREAIPAPIPFHDLITSTEAIAA